MYNSFRRLCGAICMKRKGFKSLAKIFQRTKSSEVIKEDVFGQTTELSTKDNPVWNTIKPLRRSIKSLQRTIQLICTNQPLRRAKQPLWRANQPLRSAKQPLLSAKQLFGGLINLFGGQNNLFGAGHMNTFGENKISLF